MGSLVLALCRQGVATVDAHIGDHRLVQDLLTGVGDSFFEEPFVDELLGPWKKQIEQGSLQVLVHK